MQLMKKVVLVLVLVAGVILSGCQRRMSPATAIASGLVLTAVSVPVFLEAEAEKDVFGDATMGSALVGMLGAMILTGGALFMVKGMSLYVHDRSDEELQRKLAVESKLSFHIQLAARAQRCEAASLMLQRLAARNQELAQWLTATDVAVARCVKPLRPPGRRSPSAGPEDRT